MKTIKIDNTTYEVVKNLDFYYNRNKNIYDLYERPSNIKIKIYEERKQEIDEITALTGGPFNFTIYGIKIYNWIKRPVRITKTHNFIWINE